MQHVVLHRSVESTQLTRNLGCWFAGLFQSLDCLCLESPSARAGHRIHLARDMA